VSPEHRLRKATCTVDSTWPRWSRHRAQNGRLVFVFCFCLFCFIPAGHVDITTNRPTALSRADRDRMSTGSSSGYAGRGGSIRGHRDHTSYLLSRWQLNGVSSLCAPGGGGPSVFTTKGSRRSTSENRYLHASTAVKCPVELEIQGLANDGGGPAVVGVAVRYS